MPIPGNLLTTAMAVMPHQDPERAIEIASTLDIPFWPQLPRLNYYEDMYVQASEHFPGIVLDMVEKTLRFSMDKFIDEVEETLAHFEEPAYFDISPAYSVVYHRFLELDHSRRAAIRGQLEGPISFGFNVIDQDDRPILFNDSVRPFMFEFMAKRINVQLSRLKKLNPNAFMFIDEPGLQFLFSALSGYNDMAARKDVAGFLEMIERPEGHSPVRQSGLGFSAGSGHGCAFHGYLYQRRGVFLLCSVHQTISGQGRGHCLGNRADQF